MHSFGALALAAAPMFLVARADLDFDGEDLPAICRSICRPMVELTQRCDASDLFDNDDAREDEYERNEDRLRAQCVCTNDSFNVANVASTCADCIRQNLRSGGDDDDYDDELEDINDIIRTCGFATTASFASSASDAASSITVVASAPTAASQLTTTISGATGRPNPTQGQNGPDNTSNSDNPGPTSNNDNNGNSNNNDNNDNNDDPDSWAAPGAMPLGGLSGYTVLCSFGAFVAGAAVFLL